MKRILNAVMLLLGLSVMASCEKEGGGGDNSELEGKWWGADRAEYYFNGADVFSTNYFVVIYNSPIDKIKFEGGTATIIFKNGQTLTSPYSETGNSITIDYLSYKIRSSSNNSLVLEQLPYEESVVPVNEYDSSTGDTFRGKEIFYTSGDTGAPYYFVNNSGKGIPCCPLNDGKYWYDTQVSYFSAK